MINDHDHYVMLDDSQRLPVSNPLRGPGRKCGTPVSGWQKQLVSQIGVPGHAMHLSLVVAPPEPMILMMAIINGRRGGAVECV